MIYFFIGRGSPPLKLWESVFFSQILCKLSRWKYSRNPNPWWLCRLITRFPEQLFASPGPKGQKEPKFSPCFVCNSPNSSSFPISPPASALACTFLLAKVKTKPINIQAVLSTKTNRRGLENCACIKWIIAEVLELWPENPGTGFSLRWMNSS